MQRLFSLIPVALVLAGCDEVGFSSTQGSPGETVSVTARLKVDSGNLAGLEHAFTVDPPLSVIACTRTTEVGGMGGIAEGQSGHFRAMLLGLDGANGPAPWAKGVVNLFTCTILIPPSTPLGNYYITPSAALATDPQGKDSWSIDGKPGRVHVQS